MKTYQIIPMVYGPAEHDLLSLSRLHNKWYRIRSILSKPFPNNSQASSPTNDNLMERPKTNVLSVRQDLSC